MLGLASRCCVYTNIEKRSAALENAAGLTRLDAYIYIYGPHNKMVALGYVYTLGKQTSHSPNAVRIRMPPALNS